jgi:hypothetical protein
VKMKRFNSEIKPFIGLSFSYKEFCDAIPRTGFHLVMGKVLASATTISVVYFVFH